jgi:ABC-type dipeptide/oligopeptide/nickel transport system permease subunit
VRRVAIAASLLLLAAAAVGALLPADVVLATRPDAADVGPGDGWPWTDRHGRDVILRVLSATSTAVFPGLAAAATAIALGAPFGVWSGARPGPVADAARFGVGAVASVPRYVQVLLAVAIFGSSSGVLALAAGVAWAPDIALAADRRVRHLAAYEYVLAARVHGVPAWRVAAVHLGWFGAGRAVARESLGIVGSYAVFEASLSYVGGVGVQEPWPSLGNLVHGWRGAWLDPRFLLPIAVLAAIVATTRALASMLPDPPDV